MLSAALSFGVLPLPFFESGLLLPPLLFCLPAVLLPFTIRPETTQLEPYGYQEYLKAKEDGKVMAISGSSARFNYLNPKFLLDTLRVIDDEDVCLYMTNAKAPCFIRDDENKYIYLILPINLNPAAYDV